MIYIPKTEYNINNVSYYHFIKFLFSGYFYVKRTAVSVIFHKDGCPISDDSCYQSNSIQRSSIRANFSRPF